MATSTEFMDTANNHITMPLVAAPHQLAGAMAIHEATRNKDFVALDRLLNENKSLIHAPDVVGRSPLMMSSLRGHVDVCEWLLDHGAPLNAVDINRRSAMYNAASYGFVQVVKLLMERGADPKIGDCEGNVPIIAGKKRQMPVHWPRVIAKLIGKVRPKPKSFQPILCFSLV